MHLGHTYGAAGNRERYLFLLKPLRPGICRPSTDPERASCANLEMRKKRYQRNVMFDTLLHRVVHFCIFPLAPSFSLLIRESDPSLCHVEENRELSCLRKRDSVISRCRVFLPSRLPAFFLRRNLREISRKFGRI